MSILTKAACKANSIEKVEAEAETGVEIEAEIVRVVISLKLKKIISRKNWRLIITKKSHHLLNWYYFILFIYSLYYLYNK